MILFIFGRNKEKVAVVAEQKECFFTLTVVNDFFTYSSMRTVTRSLVRIPAKRPTVLLRQMSSLPPLHIQPVTIVEGTGVNRNQITALARLIKTPGTLEIVYVRKTGSAIPVSSDFAWDLLFPPVTAYLKRIFRRFQFDEESAGECVARTWLNIVKHFNSYNPGPLENEAHFLCWVQFIARNQAIDFLNARKKWQYRFPVTIIVLDRGENQGLVPVVVTASPVDLSAYEDLAGVDQLK